ncbi:ATP-binding protein [Actinomadura litoris]|uniref:ATP-binding protein n=1 Tax=Actinomadura litoris TaxID=2678616 RepID=UPI001FA7B043|nr:ATP-binding protein [Actinomadura litoris]
MALYVVTGPPASGKTTWVQQRARHGDVVIDMDAIASVLTVDSDGHTHPHAVLRCAQRARSVAIDEALKHAAEVDVYVIHMQPSVKALDRYAEHGAHVVTIDPGHDVVMARIDEERHHTSRAVAARWYATHSDGGHERVGAGSRSW